MHTLHQVRGEKDRSCKSMVLRTTYRLESLCEFVDAVNNAIAVHDLVAVNRRVATTAAKYEVDELL